MGQTLPTTSYNNDYLVIVNKQLCKQDGCTITIEKEKLYCDNHAVGQLYNETMKKKMENYSMNFIDPRMII